MIQINHIPAHPKKVTALIAVYKAGDFIKSKIDNIKQQTAFDDCWFIFLNCQDIHDESLILKQFAEEHDNVILVDIEDYIRLYASWNIGILISRSLYITNSNVDDHWHPEYLERCAAYLDSHADVSIVSTEVLVTNKANQTNPDWSFLHSMPIDTYPATTAGPSPMWRRSLHDKYGLFEDYLVISDARQWEKYLAGGETFGLINRPLVLYYLNPESLERRRGDDGRLFREIDLS